MKVLILGATGTFGTALTKTLMEKAGYELTLFARHAADHCTPAKNRKVVNGDAVQIEELRKVVQGQDVVFCAISGEQLPLITQNLITVMEEEKVERLLWMGAVGIYNEIPEEMDGEDNLDHEPAQIPNRKGADLVEASSLNYTVLRPGYLREGAADDFVLSLKGEAAKGYISTIPSVVQFAVSLMEDASFYTRQNVSITKNMEKN